MSKDQMTDDYARELFRQRHGPNAVFPDDVRKVKSAQREAQTTGKIQIWLSPKAARFAAHACDTLAVSDLEDENDNGYYRIIADAIRRCLKDQAS